MRALSLSLSVGILAAALTAGACRGDLSAEPPVHLNPNMDQQQRYDPQEPNSAYKDGRAMRPPVEGTVARGHLKTDTHLHQGKLAGGAWADGLPASLPLTEALLGRGRKRYNIYCTPCHGRRGDGKGEVYLRQVGLPKPANFHAKRLLSLPVGELFHAITRGKGNMPKMNVIVPVADRWAIVAYLRALQHTLPKPGGQP